MDHCMRDCPGGARVIRTVCGNCGMEGYFARMCKEPKNTCSVWGDRPYSGNVLECKKNGDFSWGSKQEWK